MDILVAARGNEVRASLTCLRTVDEDIYFSFLSKEEGRIELSKGLRTHEGGVTPAED